MIVVTLYQSLCAMIFVCNINQKNRQLTQLAMLVLFIRQLSLLISTLPLALWHNLVSLQALLVHTSPWGRS